MHPWPGLRQTGITSECPAGAARPWLFQTSPHLAGILAVVRGVRGKPEDNLEGWSHRCDHTVPKIFVKPRLHIEILSSSKNLLEKKDRKDARIRFGMERMCKCRFEFFGMEVWKLVSHI